MKDDFRTLLAKAQLQTDELNTSLQRLVEFNEGPWDSSISLDEGRVVINTHGPESEVWGETDFLYLIDLFIQYDDFDKNGPLIIKQFEIALKRLKKGLKEA